MKNVSDRVIAFAPVKARRVLFNRAAQPTSRRVLHCEWRPDPASGRLVCVWLDTPEAKDATCVEPLLRLAS
jgi:hypothetical protein